MSTIGDNINTLREIKRDIKKSLQDKGSPVNDFTPFTEYSTMIDELPDSGGEEDVVREAISRPIYAETMLSSIKRDYANRQISESQSCFIDATMAANATTVNGSIDFDGVFTGKAGAYVLCQIAFVITTLNSWEFQTKYTYHRGNGHDTVMGSYSSNPYSFPNLIFEGTDNALIMYLSASGSNWNLNTSASSLVPVDGTTYYLKAGFTGTEYYIDYNTTGWSDTFTRAFELQTTQHHQTPTSLQPLILMNDGVNLNNYYSGGSMDLTETRFYDNGSLMIQFANKKQIIF